MAPHDFPESVLLYVEDPARSAQFYERLFGRAPVAAFPTGVAFRSTTAAPACGRPARVISCRAAPATGRTFASDDDREVRRLYDAWQSLGVPFEQAPMTPCPARRRDPDGHRLRVCTPDLSARDATFDRSRPRIGSGVSRAARAPFSRSFAPATQPTTTTVTATIDGGTVSCSSPAASSRPKNGCSSCN